MGNKTGVVHKATTRAETKSKLAALRESLDAGGKQAVKEKKRD